MCVGQSAAAGCAPCCSSAGPECQCCRGWVGWGKFPRNRTRKEVVNVEVVKVEKRRCKQTRNSRKLAGNCSAMFQTRQRKEKKAKGGGFSARRDLTQAHFKMAGTVKLAWWSGATRVPNPPKPQLLTRPTSRISHPFQARQPVTMQQRAIPLFSLEPQVPSDLGRPAARRISSVSAPRAWNPEFWGCSSGAPPYRVLAHGSDRTDGGRVCAGSSWLPRSAIPGALDADRQHLIDRAV